MPPDEPDEPLPPMFGQFALSWFGRVDGVVVPPPDGAVTLGAAEGSGLAAETTATAPPTRSIAETAAVRTVRLRPRVRPVVRGADGSAEAEGPGEVAGGAGVSGSGIAGS